MISNSRAVDLARVESLLSAVNDADYSVIWSELRAVNESTRQTFLEQIIKYKLEKTSGYSQASLDSAVRYLEGVSNPVLAVHAAIVCLFMGKEK